MLHSRGDKNLRGALLGGNFPRRGEGMNRFLASVGTPIPTAVEILVWVQHLFIHLFTYTYLFSLDLSNLLLACDKDGKLMHYYRIFLKRSWTNLFANFQDICQVLPKYIQKLPLWKNLAIKKSYRKHFSCVKVF